jgi:phage terminase large subunit-like protein
VVAAVLVGLQKTEATVVLVVVHITFLLGLEHRVKVLLVAKTMALVAATAVAVVVQVQ